MNPVTPSNFKDTRNSAFLPLVAFVTLLFISRSAHAQLTFSTLAGYAGQQTALGSGTNALFESPAGSVVDASGNVYISDYSANVIEKISPGGAVTILAGYPDENGSVDGSGTNALFNGPEGLAIDLGGNIYVADSGNDTIRKITPAGVVSTLAGMAGVTGSLNATGTNALFNQPAGVAVDSATNVYVADYRNHTIRKITLAGAVSTFAGSPGNFGMSNAVSGNALFYQPECVAVDTLGNVYVADTANNMIRKITAGVVSTLAGNTNAGSGNGSGSGASFDGPQSLTVDALGNVYVADTGNDMIRVVTSLGAVSTLAGSTIFGSEDGTGTAAQFWGPAGIAADSSGTNFYVADYFNGTVRKATTGGVVTTIVGSASDGISNSGLGFDARFNLPTGIAVDSSTNVYVADTASHTIREISASGAVNTLAGTPGVSGSVNGSGASALFNGPQAVAVDSSGNVYVADTGNNTIRKISGGNVTTLAGTAGTSGNTDGSGSAASFFSPEGITVDHSGNVYVADTLNYTIRKIAGTTVTTFAGAANTFGSTDGTNALFNCPKGLAADSSGNIYVADCLNDTIRQITPAGVVTTLAGIAGLWGNVDATNSAARFFQPEGVVVDGSGNIYVADAGNQTIRKITPSGTNWIVTTVGGMAGTSGFVDGTGTNALFYYPAAVTINNSGYLFVADSGNNTIRTTEPGVIVAQPTLTIIEGSANTVIISWPSPSTGFVLQQNNNVLNTSGWTTYGGTINDNGTTKSTSISPATGAVYFRLKH